MLPFHFHNLFSAYVKNIKSTTSRFSWVDCIDTILHVYTYCIKTLNIAPFKYLTKALHLRLDYLTDINKCVLRQFANVCCTKAKVHKCNVRHSNTRRHNRLKLKCRNTASANLHEPHRMQWSLTQLTRTQRSLMYPGEVLTWACMQHALQQEASVVFLTLYAHFCTWLQYELHTEYVTLRVTLCSEILLNISLYVFLRRFLHPITKSNVSRTFWWQYSYNLSSFTLPSFFSSALVLYWISPNQFIEKCAGSHPYGHIYKNVYIYSDLQYYPYSWSFLVSYIYCLQSPYNYVGTNLCRL